MSNGNSRLSIVIGHAEVYSFTNQRACDMAQNQRATGILFTVLRDGLTPLKAEGYTPTIATAVILGRRVPTATRVSPTKSGKKDGESDVSHLSWPREA